MPQRLYLLTVGRYRFIAEALVPDWPGLLVVKVVPDVVARINIRRHHLAVNISLFVAKQKTKDPIEAVRVGERRGLNTFFDDHATWCTGG